MKVKYIILAFLFVPVISFAHGGRTDRFGCHVESATKEYHCHKGHYNGKSFSTKKEGLKYINANGNLDKTSKKIATVNEK